MVIPLAVEGAELPAQAQAGSMAEALSLVDAIKELGVEGVFLDANLSPNETSGQEGRELAERIRKAYPTKIGCPVIIEYSAGTALRPYGYGDLALQKPTGVITIMQTVQQAVEEIKRRRCQNP